MSKIALYLRLSVEERREKIESESIISQREYIKNFIASNDELNHRKTSEYVDDGYSGTNTERPAFQKMMDGVKSGEIDTIIVKDMSRFMRDYITIGDYLENILPFMGVRFIAINDGYDSKNESGNGTDLDVQFKNLLYDFYSKDTSEKVKSVSNALKKQGKVLAWAPSFGYIKDPNDKHKIIIDEATAPIVEEIYEMALGGMSANNIARRLNELERMTPAERKKQTLNVDFYKDIDRDKVKTKWGMASVLRILFNEVYIGTFCYNMRSSVIGSKKTSPVPRDKWGRIENNHEPIISKEIFQKVREILAKKAAHYGIKGRLVKNSPLQGHVVCKTCGHKLTCSARHITLKNGITKRLVYFTCGTCIFDGAKHRNINAIKAENYVLEEIRKLDGWDDSTKKEAVKERRRPEQEPTKEQLEKEKDLAFYRYKQGKLSREEYKQIKASVEERMAALGEEHQTKKNAVDMVLDAVQLSEELVDFFVERVYVDEEGEMEVVMKKKTK